MVDTRVADCYAHTRDCFAVVFRLVRLFYNKIIVGGQRKATFSREPTHGFRDACTETLNRRHHHNERHHHNDIPNSNEGSNILNKANNSEEEYGQRTTERRNGEQNERQTNE